MTIPSEKATTETQKLSLSIRFELWSSNSSNERWQDLLEDLKLFEKQLENITEQLRSYSTEEDDDDNEWYDADDIKNILSQLNKLVKP